MKTPPAPPQTASAADHCLVIANGQQIQSQLPCSIEHFLVAQKLLPRSVVVEHNGEAVAPSEFSQRQLQAGDRLEIVKIVAGG
ncbi:MAG: sulfur carrier protein ThiS [Verrucomicrobiota bacterium]